MNKPVGVLLVLGLAVALALCLVPIFWFALRGIQRRNGRKPVALVAAALVIVAFDAWAIYAVAPKGGRTIAQLHLPDGRAVVVRHYRFGWLEYPTVRLYARDTQGVWTRFYLIAELVDPNTPRLVFDASEQKVQMPGVGWYQFQDNYFTHIDGGSYGLTIQLPPGIEPGEEDYLPPLK
ncbi:MAG: hypothetical protein RLZZ303_1015 [Candidatus Hydrogenedentota bacterium]